MDSVVWGAAVAGVAGAEAASFTGTLWLLAALFLLSAVLLERSLRLGAKLRVAHEAHEALQLRFDEERAAWIESADALRAQSASQRLIGELAQRIAGASAELSQSGGQQGLELLGRQSGAAGLLIRTVSGAVKAGHVSSARLEAAWWAPAVGDRKRERMLRFALEDTALCRERRDREMTSLGPFEDGVLWCVPLSSGPGVERHGLVFASEALSSLKRQTLQLGLELVDAAFARQRVAEAERYRDARFLGLFEGRRAPPVQVYDTDGRIVFWNEASERLYGYAGAEVLGRSGFDLLPEGPNREQMRRFFEELVAGEVDSAQVEVQVTHQDGGVVEVLSHYAIIEAPLGRREVVALDLNLMPNKVLQRRLESLATVDALTGCHQRHAWMGRAEAEVARAQRHDRVLSLLMVDVDHFKHVNDTWGHAAGDAVLRAVGRLLRSSLRRNDLSGRLGGEEFAILLPETSEEGAAIFAERTRTAVEALRVLVETTSIDVTISIGVATWIRGESLESTLRRADQALYSAKESGRNRVAFAPTSS